MECCPRTGTWLFDEDLVKQKIHLAGAKQLSREFRERALHGELLDGRVVEHSIVDQNELPIRGRLRFTIRRGRVLVTEHVHALRFEHIAEPTQRMKM